jgi:hypothetical protein
MICFFHICFASFSGGGGGGRISIEGASKNTFVGLLGSVGGASYVHDVGDYGYSLAGGTLAYPTGGGGAGTIHVRGPTEMGSIALDNRGITSDHPTSLYNTFQYNISLESLKVRGNTSATVSAQGIVAGSSVTIQVGHYDDEEGSRLRLEDQTIFLINSGELGGASTKVSTTQSLRSPSEFLRKMETVFYVGGSAQLTSRLDVMEGAMLVVPPILTLVRADIQIRGSLRASQMFLSQSVLSLHSTGSTEEPNVPNVYSLQTINIEDSSILELRNSSILSAGMCTVGGPEGSDPAFVRVLGGRTTLSTDTLQIHPTGMLHGFGYGSSKGPGSGSNKYDGGSFGGLGGDEEAPL